LDKLLSIRTCFCQFGHCFLVVAVLPIVRGGIKVLDPQWQASALLIKLLTRGLSVGYEPWKTLVRYRVAQTRQSRRGKWPAHSNWIMNDRNIAKQGSSMWQGVMRVWQTIQSGLEQQDPNTWAEIRRQPLFGNRLLTNDMGIQWGTYSRSNLILWMERGIKSIQDLVTTHGDRWRTFAEQPQIRRSTTAPPIYDRLIRGIPWIASPPPSPRIGQWLAPKDEEGNIVKVYHITRLEPFEATIYFKVTTKQLLLGEITHLSPLNPLEKYVLSNVGDLKGIPLVTTPL
jgi:hypothetical protein